MWGRIKMTKIEWTDMTWNPVWGCNGGCEYCYARKIARRFAGKIIKKELDAHHIFDIIARRIYDEYFRLDLERFLPTWLQSHYDNPPFAKTRKPKKIFIGSMSDIAFWKEEWIDRVAEKIRQYPQHTFQLLTKFSEVYKKLDEIMPENVWFGVTVIRQIEIQKLSIFQKMKFRRVKFVSFEPLLSAIEDKVFIKQYRHKFQKISAQRDITYFDFIDWIIIGTMSGQKRIPTKIEWVEKIVKFAKHYDVSVFIKQLEINGKVEKDTNKFPEHLRIREFPG